MELGYEKMTIAVPYDSLDIEVETKVTASPVANPEVSFTSSFARIENECDTHTATFYFLQTGHSVHA